jgi:predicted TPR repeat methyltransferase
MNRKERRAARKTGVAGGADNGGSLAASAGALVASAVRHLNAGDLAGAEHTCRQALSINPAHFDAAHLLGVVAIRAGRNDAAVDLLRRAMALNDRNAECHCHLGWALAALGRVDEAIACFRRAIDLDRTFVAAPFYLAKALRQQGRLDDAAAQYRLTLTLQPDHAAAHYDLGAVLAAQDCLDDAVVHYGEALRIEPSANEIINDLATLMERQGKRADALALYRRALSLKPNDAIAHYNLGRLLALSGQLPEAVSHLERAVSSRPDFPEAYGHLGNAFRQLAKPAQALASFERALTLDPGHSATQLNICSTLYELHLVDKDAAAVQAARLLSTYGGNPLFSRGLCGIVGKPIDARHDGEYARAVFDDFSATFDVTLGALGYSPRALTQAVAIDEGRGRVLDILDAGCGTGLCGTWLKPVARSLIGVDVSQGMLEQARGRSIYDRLVGGDVVAFMSQNPETFDLVVAADVLTYIGDHSGFLQAAHRALRLGGQLAISVESLDQEGRAEGYRLAPSGRYQHSRRCLEQALHDVGFVIGKMLESTLRQEAGHAIGAWIVVAERRSRA